MYKASTSVGIMAEHSSSEPSRKQLRGDALRSILPMVKYSSQHVPADARHLISLRASVLNDCRACIATHRRDARHDGWSEDRILATEDWTNSASLFGVSETLILRLTDAITHIDGEGSVPDELWNKAVDTLGEAETLDILVSICAINTFNRVSITTRTDPARIPDTTDFDLARNQPRA